MEILPQAADLDESGKPICPTCAAKGAVPAYNILTTKQLTGSWGGVRPVLEDKGISFKLTNQLQFMVNMHGGQETKNGNDFADSYDLSLELDLDKMFGLAGGSFFMRGKGTSGGEVSDFDREKIGGIFPTNSDAGAEEPIWVEKWWWRQRLFDDRLEFRLGRISTGADLFDVNALANSADVQFMNRALDRNPIITHSNGIGAFVNVWPTDWLYARAAVIDADSRARRTGFDTAFHGQDRFRAYWELGLVPKFSCGNGAMPGHYRFGGWYRPDPRSVFRNTFGGVLAPRTRNDDVGFYMNFDQMIWKENKSPKDKQGLSVFGRYGFAHGDVNMIEHFWSAGTAYAGLFPSRDKDTLGFGVGQGILSEQYRGEVDSRADRETVYELYYAYQLTPWCVITPDLQVVTNPGGGKDDRDAVVGGVRVRVSF